MCCDVANDMLFDSTEASNDRRLSARAFVAPLAGCCDIRMSKLLPFLGELAVCSESVSWGLIRDKSRRIMGVFPLTVVVALEVMFFVSVVAE